MLHRSLNLGTKQHQGCPVSDIKRCFDNKRSPPKILQRVGAITISMLMHKLLILVLGLCGVDWADAQSLTPEVIAPAGDHFAKGNAQLSWTLGEAVIEAYAPAGGSAQLTQGFHQTNLTILAMNDPSTPIQVRVYPNPTTGWVSIEAQSDSPSFGVALSDAQGRVLLSRNAHAPQGLPQTLDLSGYSPGLYLLHLRSQDSQNIQTFKIVKHN